MVIGMTDWIDEEEKGSVPSIRTSEVSDVDITSLTSKMQRFVHLYMTGNYTLVKLGELLDLHPNTLSNWLKRKDVSAVIADMEKTTHDIVAIQLNALTLKSINRLSNLIDSPIDGVAYQAVRDVLDRAGHKPKQEIKIDKTVTTYEQKLRNLIEITIDELDEEDIEDVGMEEVADE